MESSEAILVADALFGQDFLGRLDGGGRGVLRGVVQQGDLGGFGLQGEDQIEHGVGIQIVGGAGQVGSGSFQAFHQAGADGVGHRGENDRQLGVFGLALHRHGHRGRNADHQVDFAGDEVGDDLVKHAAIQVAVVLHDLDFDAALLFDFGEAGADVGDDLVQGRVVNEVADTDLESRLAFSGGDAGQGQEHHNCQGESDQLLHGGYLPFNNE